MKGLGNTKSSAPGLVDIFGRPSRGGGGGDPIRDGEGRVVSGVRGLFNKELLGAPPGTAQRHGPNTDVDLRPGERGVRSSWPGGVRSSWGRGGQRNPNAGHNIFGDLLESAPRYETLRPSPNAKHAASGALQQQADTESAYEKLGREYRETVVRRQTPKSPHPATVRSDGDERPLKLLPPSPSPTCPSSPRTVLRLATSPVLRLATCPVKGRGEGGGALVGGGGEGSGVEAYREWVEMLVVDRERLRQQLRDGGIVPCC